MGGKHSRKQGPCMKKVGRTTVKNNSEESPNKNPPNSNKQECRKDHCAAGTTATLNDVNPSRRETIEVLSRPSSQNARRPPGL
eukprot:4917956-Amphidinium_carterae.1